MNSQEILGVLAITFLASLAAVLAAAETALTHVGRARAEALMEDGARGAETLVRLLDRRGRMLNPVLLMVLACQLGTAIVLGALVQRRFGGEWVAVSLLVLLVVLFVFTESLPKAWALTYPNRAALLVAPIVGALAVFPPLRWISDLLAGMASRLMGQVPSRSTGDVTEGDLVAFAAQAVESEAIEATEREMIESVLGLGDTVVREVMTPRPDMVTIDSDTLVSAALDVASEKGLTRLPVIAEDIDDVVGVVHSKDLVRVERSGGGTRLVTEVLRKVRFVPETKRADELMREMQRERFHLAVVVDEYGGTAGLATLEDLLEELVGEIVDEFDREEPSVRSLVGGGLLVHGRIPIYEVNELLGVDLPDDDWDTIGGLIFNSLGHLPKVGEALEIDGVRLRVEHLQGRRITRVRVTQLVPASRRGHDRSEAAS